MTVAALRRLRQQVGLASLVVLGVVGFAALTLRTGAQAVPAAPLPVYGTVPDFSLLDQRGESFGPQRLTGSVWIADFIYTTCPGQCQLMTDRLASLQRAFAGETHLRFVSISVDPAHDTPEVLTAYARRFGGDPRWSLLTGAPAVIEALCRDTFTVSLDRSGGGREPITHSARLIVVDRVGRIRGAYDATDTTALPRLRRDLTRLLEGQG